MKQGLKEAGCPWYRVSPRGEDEWAVFAVPNESGTGHRLRVATKHHVTDLLGPKLSLREIELLWATAVLGYAETAFAKAASTTEQQTLGMLYNEVSQCVA